MSDKQSINKLGKKMNYKTKKVSMREVMEMKSMNDVMGMKDDDKDRNDGLLPIERLEELGKKVLRKGGKDNDEIVVMVGLPSNDPLEGTMFGSPREDVIGLEKQYININDITDYNSLWELTDSGWDSEDEVVYPYIIVDGYGVRWDDQKLRKEMNIYTWTKENSQKYIGSMFKGGTDKPFVKYNKPNVGRNQPCLCGSGKKFKKCCLN